MATLDLQELRKEFGQLVAVNDLSLNVGSGEFMALLGPSGCGKSTTLRMVLGLETPTKGEVAIDGKVVTDQSPKERRVGIVFQDYAIFPHMSPLENITFGLKVKGLPPDEIKREVQTACDLFDLEEVLKKPTRALNVGELQQIALARTVVTKPAIILLDEPLSNLEAFLRAKVRSQLKRFQRDLGQTTVYVTHDQVEAMALADRIAVMCAGFLQQYGTPEEVYNSPQNTFVANFIGSPAMNLVPGEVVRVDGRLAFRAPDLDFALDPWRDKLDRAALSGKAFLGIRPEHIKLENQPTLNSVGGVVWATEPLGSETIVDIRVGPSILRVLIPPTLRFGSGENVWMTFDPIRVHLFDGLSQLAVL